ncbi:MAG TPA: hypothetical protein DCK95_06915 [Anaerolineaceae bacterium]|nr:hypothetical protein [Anaerolineaceae bacterium]
MIDKKNLKILNNTIENKGNLFVAFAKDKDLPEGFEYDYRREDLYWLSDQGYIKYTNRILGKTSFTSRTGEVLTGEDYLYANVEATPEGRIIAEMAKKERSETFFFKVLPLVVSIIAVVLSSIALFVSCSRVP